MSSESDTRPAATIRFATGGSKPRSTRSPPSPPSASKGFADRHPSIPMAPNWKFKIIGDMTIRNTTKELTFEATAKKIVNGVLTGTAVAKFNMTDSRVRSAFHLRHPESRERGRVGDDDRGSQAAVKYASPTTCSATPSVVGALCPTALQIAAHRDERRCYGVRTGNSPGPQHKRTRVGGNRVTLVTWIRTGRIA